MAFTKVVGPGIHTQSNIVSHNINSSGIITATKFVGPITGGGGDFNAGIVTCTTLDVNGNGDISGNLVIGGNLTANGDFTTLNTTLREVELLRVDATDNTATAGIITQRGTGDILNLFDTSTEVLTVKDGGNLGVGTISPTHVIHSYGEGNLGGVRLENSHSTTTVSGNTAANAFPHNLILSNYSGLGSANDRIASIGFDVPTTGSYANATIAYQATNAGTGDLQFHLESGNAISEKIRFTSAGQIVTGNPVTPAHNQIASLIVLSADASSGANMLSDSSAVYNHNNPSFLAVQNRYDTGTGQESGIILSQKHLQQGSWAIYGKRTGSYVSDLIFRNRTGANASAERLRIDSAGKVSIGNESSPLGKLHVKEGDSGVSSADAEQDTLFLENNGNAGLTIATPNANTGYLTFADPEDSNIGQIIYRHGGTNANSMAFFVNADEKVQIDSNGRVLIGRDSAYGHADADNLIVGNEATNEHQGITILSHTGKYGGIYFGDGDGATGSNRGKIIYDHPNDQLRIGTGGAAATQFYLTSSGQVGINVSPSYPLDVRHSGGNLNQTPIIRVFQSSDGCHNAITLESSTSVDKNIGIQFKNRNTVRGGIGYIQNDKINIYTGTNAGASNGMTIDASGKVTFSEEIETPQDYPNIRPVLDFNFAATKKLKPEMTFTREGEASFHDGVGSVKFVSDNEPRFEHDIVTGECKGLMFEGAGTNYSWYSRFFKSSGYSSGSWVPQNGGATPTITENTHTAPDGTSSGYYMADTISGATGTAFNGNVVQQQHTAGANVKHTFSIYIKLLTATQATIYVRDGATGSISSTSAVNIKGWQRVVVTTTNALTNGVTHGFYIGNTNGDIAVWGSQIERSDHVTSYIKTTTGANGTRNADKGVHLDGEDVADVFNDGRGTLIAEAILTQSQSNNPIVGFYENFTDDNRVELRGDASSVGTARLEAVVNDSSVASLTTGLTHSGVNNVSKYAYAFELNNYAGCVNGGTVATDTGGAFPSGMDSMMIGEAVYNVDAAVIVKRIMYYADRLPNSQLVTLTS